MSATEDAVAWQIRLIERLEQFDLISSLATANGQLVRLQGELEVCRSTLRLQREINRPGL
ncbi:hypothetical protein EBE87_25200 [Pseudoroseomonas wenyumeiae]|uniref:Uncharacterized protein n=2 Tax=Teichococcus wenyumeiae TaxID=2478470 RepID=A0A3A9J7L3_9PROT|nr:hypothetical protein D6Z83_15765 [Pseudoroseomonas wenyumeiae]RMI15561.1 hypothetical protein EBE87_25200 [Pseudoroseomonas wenyumeiae]